MFPPDCSRSNKTTSLRPKKQDDINAVNPELLLDDGRTAFMEACRFGRKKVPQLLLKCAKAKGIQIPSSQSILFAYISEEIMDDIKSLIDEYQEEK